jgi:hypothetical protein
VQHNPDRLIRGLQTKERAIVALEHRAKVFLQRSIVFVKHKLTLEVTLHIFSVAALTFSFVQRERVQHREHLSELFGFLQLTVIQLNFTDLAISVRRSQLRAFLIIRLFISTQSLLLFLFRHLVFSPPVNHLLLHKANRKLNFLPEV